MLFSAESESHICHICDCNPLDLSASGAAFSNPLHPASPDMLSTTPIADLCDLVGSF
jgi:hypothetical protein